MSAPVDVLSASEIVRMSVLHPRYRREQRDVRIKAMRAEGHSLQSVADAFGLTRARVHQIVVSGVALACEGGAA